MIYKSEKRTCQNCHNSFTIEPEDFDFYERIKIPAPTFCPECRVVRRLSWRNELALYHRKCNAPGHSENMISFYPPERNLVVYDRKYWWGDEWNPLNFGREYDFSRPFFEQWRDLRDNIPLMSVSSSNAINSEYCNVAEDSRECYLISGSFACERVLYSNRISYMKDSSDLYIVHRSELCYEDVICEDSYRLFYSVKCTSCVESYFLYDCVGCTSCFGCTNLRSKLYCMWNEQLSKEEYQKRLAEIDLTSHKVISEMQKRFSKLCGKTIHRYANILKSTNVTGDNIDQARNCKLCFDITGDTENSKYVHWGGMKVKDSYDAGPGTGFGEILYEVFDTGIGGSSRNFFTSVVYGSHDVAYCFNCYDCSDLFGCIGLRTKKYCILNKQYSKEEYKKLLPKIIEHMNVMPYIDKRGIIYKYGEFFPAELSTFAYNETQAQDYFPLSKEQALEMGYSWREKEEKHYSITKNPKDLPDSLNEIDESITNEIIGCEHEGKCNDRCSAAFRITRQEFQTYRRLKVPLPRLCFACRHANRLKKRNPMKLWHRQCMCGSTGSPQATTNHFHGEGRCKEEFETSYALERPEIIYCEKCYQKEVY